jgi:hypothetical protein
VSEGVASADRLEIVEPTLADETGHCHSFLETLCGAAPDPTRFRVWAARGASVPRLEALGVRLERHFHRRLRRPEEWLLLRRLLRAPGRVFVPTAARTDLMLLDWAARVPLPPSRAYAYVHWVRPDARKLAFFRRLARRQPELVVLGPTASVVDVFAQCGFARCAVVPYPGAAAGVPSVAPGPFRHVLFAGAAREDKGFSHVVALVERLAARGEALPVTLQTSTEAHDRRDEATRGALTRLAAIRYPPLRVCPETLERAAYADLFRGAICLQPYDPREFADRVSGVTLDALQGGAPVVAVPGTWIARVVERFGAGAVATSPSPEHLHDALERVRADHARYQAQALQAGRALRAEHDGRHLLEALTR